MSEHKKVVYLSTNDPRSEVKNEKYIGKPLSPFDNKAIAVNVRGWGSYIAVDNEWNAYFTYKISDSSKVIALFKIRD